MPKFEVVVTTVFVVQSDAEYDARCAAFQAAIKCQEDVDDDFQVASVAVAKVTDLNAETGV